MSSSEQQQSTPRPRRAPPPFRRVTVRRVEPLSPYLIRVVLGGAELEGLAVEQPAASVRLLLPRPPSSTLIIPEWTGNEFLLPGGERPMLRTFTPRSLEPEALELTLDIVLHDGGGAAQWASGARPGDPAAVSGPGRGYGVDGEAPGFMLAGDESAIPAISQLLEAVPPEIPVLVHLEARHPSAQLALSQHPAATVRWWNRAANSRPGDALVAAVVDTDLVAGTRVWVAGEAAAVQRIRRHLFDDRGWPRALTTVRGYWKNGQGGDTDNQD